MVKLYVTKSDIDNIVSQKNFTKDNRIGKIGEKMAAQYLMDYKGLEFVRESEEKGDLKKWDLELKYKSKPFKYEIKTDVYIIPGKWFKPQGWDREIWIDGKDTGNIFIEFHSRGVDSGITTVLFFTSNEADRFLCVTPLARLTLSPLENSLKSIVYVPFGRVPPVL